MTRSIDYTALTAPHSKAEIKAYRARKRAERGSSTAIRIASIVIYVVVASVIGLIAVVVGARTVVTLLADAARGDAGLGAGSAIGLAVASAVVALILFLLYRAIFGLGRWEKAMRLEGFATANTLRYSTHSANPSYPGTIFGLGHSRAAIDHVTASSGRFLDIGSYRYKTGSGKEEVTHTWGFMALSLDRSLPHMILDSKANNGLFGSSNLPAAFSKSQVLSLEGDFDRYFTLYCPREYERDALYVFTPDLMALLIDEAAPYDVEIIDNWMFVYSSVRLDPLSPATYQRMFRIVDTVGAKTLSQTDRYVDERVGSFASNIVAPQGRRLKRGVSVFSIVFGAVFVLIWLVPQVLEFLSATR